MYVHIFTLWIQLIYILWVFNVIILSICHNFIDSSISGGLVPHNLFYCLQGNNHKRVGPRGTNYHCVDPYQFILVAWKAIISRESDIATLSTIGLTHGNVFTGWKAVISMESDLGALRTIMLIPTIFLNWLQGNNIKIVGPRGTKAH